MMLFQIVMAVVLLLFAGGFVLGQFNRDLTEDSSIGLGLGLFLSMLAFGCSFLK